LAFLVSEFLKVSLNSSYVEIQALIMSSCCDCLFQKHDIKKMQLPVKGRHIAEFIWERIIA
jgi:hypothetical protein